MIESELETECCPNHSISTVLSVPIYTLLHLFCNHLTAKKKQGWHLSTAILIARAGLIQQRLLTDASSIETRMEAASGLLLSLIGAAICWLLHWRQVGTHHLQPPIFRRCPFKHSPFLSLTNSTPWTVVFLFLSNSSQVLILISSGIQFTLWLSIWRICLDIKQVVVPFQTESLGKLPVFKCLPPWLPLGYDNRSIPTAWKYGLP